MIISSRITDYEKERAAALTAFPYVVCRAEAKLSFIKEALEVDTIVKSVYRNSSEILQFYCGGSGNVASSSYNGFHFSATDVPFAFASQDEAQFAQTAADTYEWESEDHEKAIRTERILPNWFFLFNQKWN